MSPTCFKQRQMDSSFTMKSVLKFVYIVSKNFVCEIDVINVKRFLFLFDVFFNVFFKKYIYCSKWEHLCYIYDSVCAKINTWELNMGIYSPLITLNVQVHISLLSENKTKWKWLKLRRKALILWLIDDMTIAAGGGNIQI